MVGGCPILWSSKLQMEQSLSTMEAEYIALSAGMKELLPMKFLVQEVCKGVGLDPEHVATIHSTVWEDNSACLTLANLEPPRMTPRSKHIAVKYHWFRSKLKPNKIEIKKIDTKEQLADILTKGLRAEQFRKIRKLLMGW